jgi:hypothetical protein
VTRAHGASVAARTRIKIASKVVNSGSATWISALTTWCARNGFRRAIKTFPL